VRACGLAVVDHGDRDPLAVGLRNAEQLGGGSSAKPTIRSTVR
jgi:hypothetical protein